MGYLSTISVISIFSRFTTFGDFEGGFGDDLVHGVSSSSEDFARVAVAGEVSLMGFLFGGRMKKKYGIVYGHTREYACSGQE